MEWEWSGSGVGVEWEWSGSGVEWEWSGSGVGVEWEWIRSTDTLDHQATEAQHNHQLMSHVKLKSSQPKACLDSLWLWEYTVVCFNWMCNV